LPTPGGPGKPLSPGDPGKPLIPGSPRSPFNPMVPWFKERRKSGDGALVVFSSQMEKSGQRTHSRQEETMRSPTSTPEKLLQTTSALPAAQLKNTILSKWPCSSALQSKEINDTRMHMARVGMACTAWIQPVGHVFNMPALKDCLWALKAS
ncbi:hypothetical protein L345_13420, partial [Ophiophagus hannah]